jgi:hypothetical protein
VYSTVLDSLYAEVMSQRYAVADRTVGEHRIGGVKETVAPAIRRLPGSSKELANSWIWRNQTPVRLSAARFQTHLPVVMVDPSASDSLTVAFSQVGFNADRTQAVVYHVFHCGRLCVLGDVTLLALVDGRWIVQASEPT